MIRLHHPHHMLDKTSFSILLGNITRFAVIGGQRDRNLGGPARPGIHASCMVQALLSSHSLSCTAERRGVKRGARNLIFSSCSSWVHRRSKLPVQAVHQLIRIRRAPSSRRLRFFLKAMRPQPNRISRLRLHAL
ncbi:hypothetical protein VSK90_08170 [Bacillus swezeyi]|uniref:hypothetical protein n=1 Tax=Bacillus swezeyi TaxID=1925020 RepID=UPI0039C68CE1